MKKLKKLSLKSIADQNSESIDKDYEIIDQQMQRYIIGGEYTYSDHVSESTHVCQNLDHLAYGDGDDKGNIYGVCH